MSRGTESLASAFSLLILDEVMKPDGSKFNVTEGRYRVLLRVQHALTDARLASSYESWLSEPFTYRKGA